MKKLLKNTDSQTLKNQSKDFLNEKKESIKNLEDFDLSKLDSENFDLLINQTIEKAQKEKIVKGQKKGKSSIYKIEVDRKKRKELRDTRNFLIMEILKNSKSPKKQVEEFDKFYKETYLLNDYSLNSFCSENSDKSTKEFLNLGIEVIKRFKSQK